MKINADLREKLAAEYVLGTLTGNARKRFERAMMEDWRVREEVWLWESQFAPMLVSAEPVAVSANGYRRISERLFGPAPRSRLSHLLPVLSSALLGAVLTSVLLLLVLPASNSRFTPAFAAVAQNENQVDWRFSFNTDFSTLSVSAINARLPGNNHDYELWVLPGSGAPLSLGVIRAANQSSLVTLNAQQQQALQHDRLLAISLEPHGGSPTGAPTGPVVHTATIVAL